MFPTSLLLALSSVSLALPLHSVGKLPSLGWNSWNAFHCDVDESKVLSAANQFITLGLKDAGYTYVNVDDCWSNHTGRDTQGRIQPNMTLFPDGISGTASKIHAMGLKMGIYSDAGTATCAGYPASLMHETTDAETFSSWGIDYLKYDNCNVPSNWTDASNYTNWADSNTAKRYQRMSDAIAALDKPFFLELCEWGTAEVWTWAASVGLSWRMTGDINPSWSSITSIVSFNVQHLNTIGFYAHNDMDMMEIGNGNLTIQEQRSHFAIWAFLKSPILLGTDLSTLNSTQVEIITNKELIAFSQDETFGGPAMPFGTVTTSPPENFSGKSTKGTHVFILNTESTSAQKTITFANVPGLKANTKYLIHDMWTGNNVGTFSTSWSTTLAAHDTGAWLITPA